MLNKNEWASVGPELEVNSGRERWYITYSKWTEGDGRGGRVHLQSSKLTTVPGT